MSKALTCYNSTNKGEVMEYTIKLTEEELGTVLLALIQNKELQYKIKDQTWTQVKVSV